MKAIFASITRRVLDCTSAGWLLGIGAAWLLIMAGIRPLMLPDEGRYVGIAWEMLSSGNWLVPTLDGMPFFHKPPLFYWLTTLGMQLFGANEWAGRIASTTSAILASAAVFAFIRRHVDKPTANLSVIILLTQPFFFAGAQFANLDMLVAAMISITIVAGADAVLNLERGLPYRRSLAACYVFAALGVLAKGLIGFVLPGAILFVWLMVRKQFKLIPRLLPAHLIVLFFMLSATWFILMQKSFSGFWDYFFVYHHFRRFAETGFNNQQAFWFYIPVLLLGTIPWSPWIVRAISGGFLRDRERLAIRSLMILWTLGIVAFFSLPKSKLVGYILPALPPFAYLIADLIQGWLRASVNDRAPAWIGASIVGASVFCVAIVVGTTYLDPSGLQAFSARTRDAFKPGDQIVMLDEYEYDMPFYMRAEKHPWVVSDWKNPEIPKRDNWQKELYDAGQFSMENMAETLISADEFSNRLCAHQGMTFWVWGKTRLAARYSFLDDKSVMFSNAKQSLWRLDGETLRQLRFCGERPSNG
jgi:4-amino-4-deoxy-L-arabinose transferase-like glycosyltransferase